MRISVVIPARNEEDWISLAVEALLAQDHPDFEVIVVDNGSTDRTSEVARRYPIKVLHEGRAGTMWACKRGFDEAVGDIIVRMDADCVPEKDWLSRGSEHFNDEYVVAATGPYEFSDTHPLLSSALLMSQQYPYRWFNEALQYLGKGAILIGGNSFMRRGALESAGGFNTDLVFYGDDTDTAKRLSAFGRVVFDPDLTMKTSARRYQREGFVRTNAKYFFHFFKQIVSKKNEPSEK